MYEQYMKDPATPENVRKAKKESVLRLLENRAIDHYQVIPTNAVMTWTFAGLDGSEGRTLAVRMRFTDQYEMRQDMCGTFTLGSFAGVVSNITQAVLTIPLAPDSRSLIPDPSSRLSFFNSGTVTLMLRPRKDLNVLVEADAFGWNLVRAFVALVAILTLVVSLGVFLSAGLGRPVALFVAFVMLIVGEMSPSVVAQYPDELETNPVDRLGLVITRVAADITRPVSAATPLEALSCDECVEWTDILRLVLLDAGLVPLVVALLAAFVLPRKQEES